MTYVTYYISRSEILIKRELALYISYMFYLVMTFWIVRWVFIVFDDYIYTGIVITSLWGLYVWSSNSYKLLNNQYRLSLVISLDMISRTTTIINLTSVCWTILTLSKFVWENVRMNRQELIKRNWVQLT